MDFFEHQDRARKQTSRLVVLYGLAVAGIVGSIYLAIAVGLTLNGSAQDGAATVSLWDPGLFAIVTVAVLGLVLTGSLFKTMQLSKGGSVVALSLGGRALAPDTRDAAERRLLNVVEEMALAAGIAVPQVYLLDDERGINAFAAGFSTRDAVIGITRGCVEQLSRDEIQGVVAHEFSHIVNGDMRLNIRLMGILFGILMLTIVGRVLLRSAYLSGGRSRSDKRGNNPLPFIGLALIIIGYIGVFFANLIKSAISRQREFFADASAVQYTRNPSGIAGALKKIGGLSLGATIKNPYAGEASHLFFGQSGGFSLGSMLATHPPLAERIKRLDPAFNTDIARLMNATASSSTDAGVSGFAGGRAGSVNISAAAATLDSIPDPIMAEVRDVTSSRAVIYGLLWAGSADVQSMQQAAINSGDPQAATRLTAIRSALEQLPDQSRLPIATLAVPALRTMNNEQYSRFRKLVKTLTEADQEIDLFEFALSHMILRHVESAFVRTDKAPIRYHSMADVLPACTTVIAGLAIWGTSSSSAAQTAYQTGLKALGQQGAALQPDEVSLEDVSRALSVLTAATPTIKRKVIDACTACILADGQVAIQETELLRAVADAMDVPMPPLPAP